MKKICEERDVLTHECCKITSTNQHYVVGDRELDGQ